MALSSSLGPRLFFDKASRDGMERDKKVHELCAALFGEAPAGARDGHASDVMEPVTLTFVARLAYAGDGGGVLLAHKRDGPLAPPATPARTIALAPALESAPTYARIRRFLPAEMFAVTLERDDPLANKQAEWTERTRPADDELVLTLNTVSLVHLRIDAVDDELTGMSPLWRAQVPVPTDGDYEMPVPLPQLFGNEKFAMSLTDYGAITALAYGKDSGAPAAADLAATLVTALPAPSESPAASRAALIAAQQRAVRCLATPRACTD